MAEKLSNERMSESHTERLARFGRNINIVGAIALGGAAILAPPVAAGALGAWAGLNALQAGGFEAGRRWAKKRRR